MGYNAEHYRNLRAANICTACGKNPTNGNAICSDCQTKNYERTKLRRQRLLTSGLCYTCGKQPVTNGAYCANCAQQGKIAHKSLRSERITNNLCVGCGQLTDGPNRMCSSCAEKQRANHKKLRQRRKEQGLCRDCDNPVGPQSIQYCEYHWSQYNARMRELYFDGHRQETLERDNFTCLICANTVADTSRLEVHHIDGNPKNNQPENLATLCNACHNAITRLQHCKYPARVIAFIQQHTPKLLM